MTNQSLNSPSLLSDEILLQASDWQARLWTENVTAEDIEACLKWRKENSQHEHAWQLLNGLNQQFDHIPKPQQQILLQKDQNHISSWIKKGSTFAFVLGLGIYLYQQNTISIWMADYQSNIGEIKRIELNDGTQLILASNSAANFDESTRQIDLIKGQIFIETGHKFQHLPPLKVQALSTTIQPLGTQFTVTQSKKNLSVAVYEGSVSIHSEKLDAPITLASGWQIHFNPSHLFTHYKKADSFDLAWIQHKLVIEQMPLCDFLAKVDQYRTGYISCETYLQQYKVSGTYSLDHTDQILLQIAETLPVEVNRYTDYFTTVKAKPNP